MMAVNEKTLPLQVSALHACVRACRNSTLSYSKVYVVGHYVWNMYIARGVISYQREKKHNVIMHVSTDLHATLSLSLFGIRARMR